MTKPRSRAWFLVLGILMASALAAFPAAAADRPAIVLTAFGTSTAAQDTYRHIDALAKKRFPGYEIRWAFTSHKVRKKVWEESGQELKDLPQTLGELRTAGLTQVAVQSLHMVPGEEWDKKVVEAGRQFPGLKVALGKPLLSSEADQVRVLKSLAKTFPRDLKKTAVVLVGHGSPHPQGEAAYLAFERRLRSRYPGQNVFFGVIEGKPSREAALEEVAKSGVSSVVLIPFLVVAGEHVHKDILGDEPDSWKSRLLAQRPYRIDGRGQGLGYEDEIIGIFLDHLNEALKSLGK